MRWRRLAFWITICSTALIALVLTWLWFADLGRFKPHVETFVSREIGREVTIDGPLHIDLARRTRLVAEDVRIRNADWAEDPHMATAGRVEIRFNLWSVLSGPLILDLIDIDDVDIQLVNPADNAPNWVIAADQESEANDEQDEVGFLINEARIDNLRAVLNSVERNYPLTFNLTSLRQSHRTDGLLELDIDASLNDRVIRVNGELGPWNALLRAEDVRFDLDAVIDTFALHASGHIDDLARPGHPEIQFTASGPDIDDLTRLLGLGEEGNGDINLAGSIEKTPTGQALLLLEGNVGESEIQSRASVASLREIRDVDVDITASGPDFGRILRIVGIHQVREAPFMIRIDAETQGNTLHIREGNMVFAGAQFDISGRLPKYPSIDDAVLRLGIEGPDIGRFRYITGLPGAAEGAFSIDFTIDVIDDGVEVLDLQVRTALGEIAGSGRLGAPPDFLASEFELQVRSSSLRRLASAYGVEGLPEYPVEINGGVRYVEEGLRTLAPVSMKIGEADMSMSGLLALTAGIVGSDLAFTLKGPDLSEFISPLAETDRIPALPYDLEGRMTVSDDAYRFNSVIGSVGSSRLEVDGRLGTATGLAGSALDFSLRGPAITEVTDAIGDVRVRRGPYEFSGSMQVLADRLRLSELHLERPAGELELDIDLGMPLSRNWMDFRLRGGGADVRSLLPAIEPFEAAQLRYALDVAGSQRGQHWDFDEFRATVGAATIDASGDLDFADAAATTGFSFQLAVPNLAELGTFAGRNFHEQGFRLSAQVAGRDGVLEINDLDITLGQSDAGGTLRYTAGDIPTVDIDIDSKALVFLPLLEPAEFEFDPEPEFEDGRLVPDVAVPFAAMEKLNASLDIDIEYLQSGRLVLRDIDVDALLENGGLHVKNAGLTARSGALTGRMSLLPEAGAGLARLELVARQLAFGASEQNANLEMKGDVDLDIRSTGTDLRTLLGNADGAVFVNVRGGKLAHNRFIRAVYGSLLEEILNTVNPFRATDPYTEFECIILPLTFDNGVLTGAPNIFVSTSKIRMAATPSVDFKSEKLRVNIRTTPRRFLSISAGELVNPYVQVVGTLTSPRLAVDEAGVLLSGGAAVATGGLTILARGVWNRLIGSGKPCDLSTDRALESLGDRLPDLVIDGLERIE